MHQLRQPSFKLRATRFATVAMTLLFIAALCVPTFAANIVAPAGSIIGNQATATYTDANSVSRQAFSNLVQTTVTQIYSATLTASQSKYATPGTQVLFPHTYTNTGNGPDTVTFAVANLSGTAMSNLAVYLDNGTGVPANTTNINSVAQPIAAGATIKVIAVATLPAGSGAGGIITLGATSGGGGAVTGDTHEPNQDTITLDSNAVINVTKAMSPVTGQSGMYTVTLTYQNTGNNTATAVAMIDDLVAQGTDFKYCEGATLASCPAPYGTSTGTGSASWNGTGFADGAAPGGLTWSIAAPVGGMTATVASVAPGVTGTISYNVVAVTPASYPATYSNYAKYNYNDGSVVVPGAASYINTNTVNLAFNGYAGVKFTAPTTGAYTAGTGTAPAVNTTPDINKIASAAYPQGATISWSQTLANKGQVTDTFNLTVDSIGAGTTLDPTITGIPATVFPVGTVFQLYRADGKTPLTDTNGDGVVDSGPLAGGTSALVFITATLPAGTTVCASGCTYTGATTFDVNLVATSTNSTASNYPTTGTGLQDVIEDEVVVASTSNTTVDVEATSSIAGCGSGIGTTGEGCPGIPASGNPGSNVVIPFWVFNTTAALGAPDAYNLSFRYDAVDFGSQSAPLTAFTTAVAGSVPPAITTAYATIPAWTVQIAPNTGVSCSTYGAPVSATNVIAAQAGVEYCLVLQVPASYSAGLYHFAVQAQSNATGAIDQMAVDATVNTLHSVSINPSNAAQVYAGGTVVYKHVVTNGGNVTETSNVTLPVPTVQATPAGWSVSAWLDGTGAGSLTSAATSLPSATYTIPSIAPGQTITYFLVVQAPASANPGDINVATWGPLALTAGTNAGSPNTSVTDTTTVITGQVKLVKSQYMDAGCSNTAGAFSTTPGAAHSGQCVIYQIVATNTGTTNITGLTIADAAPPYTTYETGYVVTNVNTCGMTVPTWTPAIAGGATAPFTFTYTTGPMTPTCTATITFSVKLN